ncbi:MAG: hypothetical protein LBU51_11110 [Bacteroidales bacterium]|jgi:hypothetical protein|nr:hypothetical protein [Bacteroidales bacterium]
MENDVAGTLFENNYGMAPIEAMTLIETFFANELIRFRLQNKYHNKSGYWGFCYCYGLGVEFSISSGRGYLDYSLIINKEVIDLIQYDAQLNYISASSEKNIKYVLNMFKRFLFETKDVEDKQTIH